MPLPGSEAVNGVCLLAKTCHVDGKRFFVRQGESLYMWQAGRGKRNGRLRPMEKTEIETLFRNGQSSKRIMTRVRGPLKVPPELPDELLSKFFDKSTNKKYKEDSLVDFLSGWVPSDEISNYSKCEVNTHDSYWPKVKIECSSSSDTEIEECQIINISDDDDDRKQKPQTEETQTYNIETPFGTLSIAWKFRRTDSGPQVTKVSPPQLTKVSGPQVTKVSGSQVTKVSMARKVEGHLIVGESWPRVWADVIGLQKTIEETATQCQLADIELCLHSTILTLPREGQRPPQPEPHSSDRLAQDFLKAAKPFMHRHPFDLSWDWIEYIVVMALRTPVGTYALRWARPGFLKHCAERCVVNKIKGPLMCLNCGTRFAGTPSKRRCKTCLRKVVRVMNDTEIISPLNHCIRQLQLNNFHCPQYVLRELNAEQIEAISLFIKQPHAAVGMIWTWCLLGPGWEPFVTSRKPSTYQCAECGLGKQMARWCTCCLSQTRLKQACPSIQENVRLWDVYVRSHPQMMSTHRPNCECRKPTTPVSS